MITCTQEVRDLFMASHRQVMRITLEGSAIRDSEIVYAVLSDSTEQRLGALALSDGTDAGSADTPWALFKGYIQDISAGFEITEDDILVGGFVLDRYSMCTNRIEIGSAVSAELTLNLRNLDGSFDAVKFEGAEMHVELGVKDWDTDDPVQWISLGYFTADKQPKTASSVQVTALDRMVWFDRDVDWTQLTFPCTVQSLISQVCTICGITCATTLTSLPNYNYSITYGPETKIPYRTLIQWCAFLTGTCAQMDENGHLSFRWYTDCGVTIDASKRYSHDIEEDDIVLSGIYYKSEAGLEYLDGTADYPLEMSGCQILQNNIETALHNIGTAVTGFTYRPFSAVIQSAPFLEPLDMITFVDRKGTSHPCIISKTTYTGNASTPVSGVGETSTEASYSALSGLTRKQTEAVDDAKKYATNYISSDEHGVMVANMTDGVRYIPSEVPDGVRNAYIDPDGFYVRDGQDVVAKFATESRIGKEDANHLDIDATGIQGVNEDGVTIFNMKMNGAGRVMSRQKNYTRDPVTQDFPHVEIRTTSSLTDPLLLDEPPSEPMADSRFVGLVWVWELVRSSDDGLVVHTQVGSRFSKGTPLTDTQNIEYEGVNYGTVQIYYDGDYTFSVNGYLSTSAVSAGYFIDVIGLNYVYTIILRDPVFTFGTRTSDAGRFSTIIGKELSASHANQFACGKYNTDDSDYAFMLGNGSEEDGDSNAFVVTWDGDPLIALDEYATSGTDAELYSAITALGWEDDVII